MIPQSHESELELRHMPWDLVSIQFKALAKHYLVFLGMTLGNPLKGLESFFTQYSCFEHFLEALAGIYSFQTSRL